MNEYILFLKIQDNSVYLLKAFYIKKNHLILERVNKNINLFLEINFVIDLEI